MKDELTTQECDEYIQTLMNLADNAMMAHYYGEWKFCNPADNPTKPLCPSKILYDILTKASNGIEKLKKEIEKIDEQ